MTTTTPRPIGTPMLSFRLSDDFISRYVDRRVDWGYPDAAGNALGEITYLRTYSRLKDDGTKERWYETCRRVIEGMFSLQKDHVKAQRLPWSDVKAQRAAEDAYERLFTFKWTPPGRGLAVMGTPLVNEQRNSAALQSCAFVSTAGLSKVNPAEPFEFLMDASLLGVGVGNDVLGAAAEIMVNAPLPTNRPPIVIPDTREGWVESTGTLLRSYLTPNREAVTFDYSAIRPAGSPIKTFGGTAAGAGPLIRLHDQIRHLLDGLVGRPLPGQAIMDIANMIGVCVVSGNVRRSALLSLGHADDESFVYAKDYERYPHRTDYGYMSNNSVIATVGQDLSGIVDSIRVNGEPGVVWLDLARSHGRLADPADNRDHRVAGVNPCSLSGDTLVHTTDGPQRIDALNGTPFWALVNGEAYYSPVGTYVTGQKELYRLITKEGYTVTLTDNHEVLTRYGWVEAGALTPGDKIVVHDHRAAPYWPGDGTFHEGWTRGWLASWRGMRGYKTTTQESDEQSSSDFHRGYLRGIFDTDGHIEGWDDRADHKGTSIRLGQFDLPGLQAVQRMLLRLGIFSRIYPVKASYNLVVDGDNVPRFRDMVGFNHTDKARKLEHAVQTRSFYSTRMEATFEALEFDRFDDVWDLSVSTKAAFDAHGLYVHNSEQTLESYETCCLVETHLNRAESLDDLKRTLKVAYLYGKTVTLIPTHWPRTNAIMQRNRRIGTSVTGLADFADNHGIATLREWLDDGYATVRHYDTVYSEWLGVRESIKVSSVKPSGTVSILSGASPGVHWTPGGQYFERRIRFAADDPMVDTFRAAGYPVEPAAENPDYTVVVTFPVRSGAKRSEGEVSIFEKAHLAALAQRHWSDNAVSVTVSFNPETEGQHVGSVLSMYAGQLKAMSFLPMATASYAQPPYTKITREEFDNYAERLLPLDLAPIYDSLGSEALGEKYCTTDVCEIKTEGVTP